MVLVNRFTAFCIKNGIIADDDADWFSYALERRICNCAAVLLLFPLGCWLSNWIVSLSFFLSFYFLRKRASGFHAKTFAGCFLFSLISTFIIFRFAISLCGKTVQLGICIVSTALIFGLAPFDHPNMHMSSNWKPPEKLQDGTRSFLTRHFWLRIYVALMILRQVLLLHLATQRCCCF